MLEMFRSKRDPHRDFPDWKFSPAAIEAMRFAVEEAHRLNHEWLGPEHLLLGCTRTSDCEAAQVLANSQLTTATIRSALEAIHGFPPEMTLKPKFSRTPEHRKIIQFSIDEAHALEHSVIGTGHFLLAMLRSPCDAMKVIDQFNISRAEIEQATKALLATGETRR